MAILLLGTTIGGYAAIHAGNIASQSVNYANTSGSTAGSATSLVSPNGATVIAGDSAMPAGAQSFIHTLAQGPGGNDGHILGMTWANASVYGAQIFLDTDPNDIMAIRSRSNAGVWTSWKTVLHSSNYNSYSPTLTGTGASGTWGINITGNSATVAGYSVSGTVGINTVVIRDVNGYIYANYINSNVSETENPTIGSFFTSNGDGWLRKSSIAHVRTQLGNYGNWITSAALANYITTSQVTSSMISGLNNMLGVTSLPYSVDITVDGDPDRFYAVQFWGGDQDVWRRIIIKRGYGEPAPWDPIGTGVHHGGLLLDWEGNFGGWGGAEYADRLRVFNESYTNVCADMFIWSHSMGYVFMLRGGGAVYHLHSDQAINGFYQSGSPDILYSTSTLSYDDSWSGTNQYDVPAPAPLSLGQVNLTRIDGLRTKKQSLLDGRYFRQGIDISGITNVSSTNFLASNAFYLNGTAYFLNSTNGGIYTNARFESGTLIVAPGGNSSQWNTAHGWGNHAAAGYQSASTAITTGNIGSQSVSYAATAGSAPNGSNINQFYNVNSGDGNGLRFWGGSDSYKISMGVGALYQYGPVTDYSIKMQMNDSSTDRGFTWGRISYAPIAALNSTSGDMQIAGSFTTTSVNAPSGYVSNGNPWGTANSAYFPNGITTAGNDNWVYGHTYVGNAPGNGAGHEYWSDGSEFHKTTVGTASHGQSGKWLSLQSALGNFIPYSFESERGNHSWGTVARYRINNGESDRPSIQFSWGGSDTRWNVGYCYADDLFRITQNMGYRNDNSTSDGWGTERFRIDTSGNTYAAIGGTLYANGNAVIHAGNIGSQSVTYATNSTRLYASDSPYTYGGAAPYYMYMNYDGGSYWELKVSPATPGAVRVAYSNLAGSANAVAWTNVSGRPTALSQFTNDLVISTTDNTKLPLAGGVMSGRLTLKSISGVEQTVPNDFGAYLHLGDWGVGRTDPGAVLVNTAYRADYATDLFDMNISRFTNNSGYITSSGSISGNAATATTAARANRANGNFYIDDNYGNSIVGVYTSTRYQGVFAMGDSYKLPADGTTTGNLYGLAWSHPNAGGVAGNLNDHGLLVINNGVFAAAISSSIRAAVDMRAPYFYGSGSIRVGDMWGGAGLYRPSGSMVFGIEDSDWVFSKGAATQAYFAGGDGNLWMRWAGDWLSNLLGAKQNNLGFTPYNATNPAGYITSGDTTTGIFTTFLGNGTSNISSGYTRVIRNENGLGGNPNYAPILHIGASDTMWQIAGPHAGQTNLVWRSGYAGTWETPWWTIYHSGNFTNNSSNWNTAFGWGNHASAGYLTSLPSHNHDDRYYTETESDARYIQYGSITSSFGLNDNKLYLRTNGDNNHYIWNAADDWEEIVAYSGTGLRIKSSTGVTLATFSTSGNSMDITGNSNTTSQRVFSDLKINFPSGDGGGYSFASSHYSMGLDSGNGAWSHPHYRDLIIGYHTGIRLGANYSGIRFYNNSPTTDANNDGNGDGGEALLMTIGGYVGTANHTDVVVNNNLFANASMRSPIFYDSNDTAYYGNFASTSRMNAIVYDNLYFSGNQAYGFIGTNVYADTINGRGSDPLELNYYDGGSVIIGTGANGSKALYAGSLYDAGNRVYSAANPQVNISGNSATASNVEWGNVSSKPASWLSGGALVGEIAPSATAFPSGFYQSYLGAGNPTGTWFNYINVRHSNTGNGHGYQLGMSYYDNILWFRSYQGGLEPSFQSWAYAISSQNIASQSVANAVTVGGYSPSNFLGKNGNSYYQQDTWIQVNGTHGLYWPAYYGGHFSANDLSSYTQFAFRGSKNSYGGFYDDYSRVNGAMYDSGGNGGVYREANGLWYWYYHVGNNSMGIGGSTNSSSYVVYANGNIYATGDIVAYSDRRKKTDIVTIDSALDKVMAMRGVFYTKIDESDKGRQVGVIAQEVNEILPEAVTYAADVDEYGVKYGNIVGVLIEAIKEQQKEIDELKAKLN